MPDEAPPVSRDEEEIGKFGLAADFVDEYCMIAEMRESEALEPRDLKEARSGPDWLLWEKAIKEELAVLKEAGTWELVDAPLGANIVGSKWVFRAKKDATGKVVRYKARLVAQGFSQVPGVNYFDTFAPVARLASIRAVLAMSAVNDYEIHQIDIKGGIFKWKTHPGGDHFHETTARISSHRLGIQSLSSVENLVWSEAVWTAMVSISCRNYEATRFPAM